MCFLHAGAEDALHLCLVLIHREIRKGLLAAHQASRAVGSGAVPVRVTLADADETAIAHIHGDQQLLAALCGHGALTQDHFIGVDIVVDGGELLQLCKAHAGEDDVRHGLAVEDGKLRYSFSTTTEERE